MSALDNPLRASSSVRELVILVKLLYPLGRIRMFDFFSFPLLDNFVPKPQLYDFPLSAHIVPV